MPKKADPNLLRIALMINREDYQRMQDLYTSVGVSSVIRQLMRAHLAKVDKRTAEILAAENLEELDV